MGRRRGQCYLRPSSAEERMMKWRNMKVKLSGVALAGAALACFSPAAAQVLLYDPQLASSPIMADDPLVGLPMPGATPAEYRAHMLWNLRSGLNVAALQ